MELVKELPDKKHIEKSTTDKFFLENNFEKLERIVKFFDGSLPFMLVNGFVGTGKSLLINEALKYLKDDVIVLKYDCFETTSLDDILLVFFDKFKNLTAQNIIQIPKVRTDNFTQKITAYFDVIEKPTVIVIDSFEQVLQSERQNILDFLFHIANYYNVKIVITSRKFNYELFGEKYEKLAISALEKGLFEKYLKSQDIKQIGPLSDELYKNTRGYWFYTNLSVKMMKIKELSLPDFLAEYSKSFLSFSDFLLREALSLANPVDGHLIRFLTIIRHPVSSNLLKTLDLYNEERIQFFVDNMVLRCDGNLVYLQDYYKTISENSIADNIAVKIHKNCVALYETQLPLKPFERDMLISRKTMRNEIEYHEMFIPKKPVITEKIEIIEHEPVEELKEEHIIPKNKKEKDEQIKKISFVFESEADEIAIMNKIAVSINNFLDNNAKKQKILEEIKGRSLIDLINLAKLAEEHFDYQRVIFMYQQALTMNTDIDYYTFLPKIYTHLARAFRNTSDWFNAIKYFENAIEFFGSMGDLQKVFEYKYEIANVYYQSFKRDKSVEILKDLLKNRLPENIEIKAKLLLSNITGIWQISEMPKDLTALEKPVLAELYFNFGLEADKNDDVELAVKYFKKCVETSRDRKINPYLSSALSNLAMVYDENGKSDLAVKYLHESIRLDELSNNYNGIYISSMKLAQIYADNSSDKAIEKLNSAKVCAEELDDPFYIASCEVTLGDLCVKTKDYKNALRHYKEAYTLAIDNFTSENIAKIETRIRDITKVYNAQ